MCVYVCWYNLFCILLVQCSPWLVFSWMACDIDLRVLFFVRIGTVLVDVEGYIICFIVFCIKSIMKDSKQQ